MIGKPRRHSVDLICCVLPGIILLVGACSDDGSESNVAGLIAELYPQGFDPAVSSMALPISAYVSWVLDDVSMSDNERWSAWGEDVARCASQRGIEISGAAVSMRETPEYEFFTPSISRVRKGLDGSAEQETAQINPELAGLSKAELAVVDDCSASLLFPAADQAGSIAWLQQFQADLSARVVSDRRFQTATEIYESCLEGFGLVSGSPNTVENSLAADAEIIVGDYANGRIDLTTALERLEPLEEMERRIAPMVDQCEADRFSVERQVRYEVELDFLAERGDELSAALDELDEIDRNAPATS